MSRGSRGDAAGPGKRVHQRESGRTAAREEHAFAARLFREPFANGGQLGQQGLGRRREVVGENHVVGASSGEVANEHVLGHGARRSVKALIGLGGADALCWFHQHHGAPRRFQTALQNLAHTAEQGTTPVEEKRHVSPKRPGNVGHALVIGRKAPRLREAHEHRRRVRRAAAQAALGRDVLFDAQLDGLGKIAAHRPGQAISSFEGEVVGRRHSEVLARAVGQVDGHDKVVRRAAHGNVLAGRPFGGALRQLIGRDIFCAQVQRIMQRERVHDGVGIVVAVLAARPNGQKQIHLRRRHQLHRVRPHESSRRPLGLPGRRQQVHFRLAIALGVLGHSRSFP